MLLGLPVAQENSAASASRADRVVHVGGSATSVIANDSEPRPKLTPLTAPAPPTGSFRHRAFALSTQLEHEVFQALDPMLGEAGHTVLADTIDPQASVVGLHVGRHLVQPLLVFAEQFGDVGDREDGRDRRHGGGSDQ